MRGKKFCASILAGLALAGSLSGRTSGPPAEIVVVPFELTSQFLVVVSVEVDGTPGLRFIVDTGASRSAIDQALAKKLKLSTQPGRAWNYDRYIATEWTEIAELKLGELRLSKALAMVVDLAKCSQLTNGVDGIVGMDVLSRTAKLTIDYAASKLYFSAAENPAFSAAPQTLVVPIVIQGQVLRLAVDTGLSEIVLFRERLNRRGVNLRMQQNVQASTMGRIAGREVVLPDVELGSAPEIVIGMLIDGPGEQALPNLDGFLGVASLHAKKIQFDFVHMILRWQ